MKKIKSDVTYHNYFNPTIVGLIFAVLAVSVGLLVFRVDEVSEVNSVDDPRPTEPFQTSPQFIDTIDKGTDFVRSRISEVMANMERNSVFNAVVGERRWELSGIAGNPTVCVTFGEGKAAGEIVGYRVIAFIFDANGEYARGITIIMNTNLEIIDIFDWAIMSTRLPQLPGDVLNEQ